MYNIIQLNDKNLSELQVIAKELGIKKADSYKKEDLVYKILDEQAIVGATKKVAADKLKEERKNEEQKKKRSRAWNISSAFGNVRTMRSMSGSFSNNLMDRKRVEYL